MTEPTDNGAAPVTELHADTGGSIEDRLTRIEATQVAHTQALNTIGAQLQWVSDALAAAFAGFTEMREGIEKAGPAGLLKMMLGGGGKPKAPKGGQSDG